MRHYLGQSEAAMVLATQWIQKEKHKLAFHLKQSLYHDHNEATPVLEAITIH